MKRNVKRKSRWECSPGWVMQGFGTLVLVGGWFASLWLPGWVLGHVPNAVEYIAARLR